MKIDFDFDSICWRWLFGYCAKKGPPSMSMIIPGWGCISASFQLVNGCCYVCFKTLWWKHIYIYTHIYIFNDIYIYIFKLYIYIISVPLFLYLQTWWCFKNQPAPSRGSPTESSGEPGYYETPLSHLMKYVCCLKTVSLLWFIISLL